MIDSKKVKESLKQAQERNERYYDRASKDLCELQPNDTIRIQVQDQWVPGVVVRLIDTPRSYIVRGHNGREYRRNRRHLRRVDKKQVTPSVDDDDEDHENASTDQAEQAQDSTELPQSADTMSEEPVRTSRGRIVKQPTRYQNFVKL